MRTAQSLIVQAQQLRRRRHIVLGSHTKRDPSRVRQHVMCLSTPCSDQLTPHAHRKWNVEHAVDVHVTDFATINAKLESAKSMWQNFDTGPFPYRGLETARDVFVSDDASP